MGKIRTRILGLEEVEKKQKEEQKKRSTEKKAKVHLAGMKGGERMKQIEVGEEAIAKMEKAKKILEEKPTEKKETKKLETKRLKKKTRGKRYEEAKRLVVKKKSYAILDAVELLKKMNHARFDESVELHLNVDKEGLRGEVDLPNPTGKSARVAVVDEKVLADVERGKIDFDVLITHPQFMPKLAKFAKVLGPKGLMPNPKAGTISDKPEEAAKKFSGGVLRWKTEAKAPLIHQMIGKTSHAEKKLVENASLFLSSVGKSHIQKAFIKTTMSPAVRVDVEKI